MQTREKPQARSQATEARLDCPHVANVWMISGPSKIASFYFIYVTSQNNAKNTDLTPGSQLFLSLDSIYKIGNPILPSVLCEIPSVEDIYLGECRSSILPRVLKTFNRRYNPVPAFLSLVCLLCWGGPVVLDSTPVQSGHNITNTRGETCAQNRLRRTQ